MLYFAISPSAINPHCGARLASALACLPQVGIQLGAGAISFSATVCPLQSFVKKKKRRSRPSGENRGLVGNIKKNKKKTTRAGEGGTWWMGEDGGWVDTKTTRGRRKKMLQNCLSVEVRARPLMGDSIEQNMYWRQRLCLLPVPFQ